jgi:hypothetical protein
MEDIVNENHKRARLMSLFKVAVSSNQPEPA